MRSIPLGEFQFALVDPDDFERLRKYRWFAKKSKYNWYAVRRVRRNGRDRLIRMHREITNCPAGLQVHHRNGDGLDNRKCNLLVCRPGVHRQIHQEGF